MVPTTLLFLLQRHFSRLTQSIYNYWHRSLEILLEPSMQHVHPLAQMREPTDINGTHTHTTGNIYISNTRVIPQLA